MALKRIRSSSTHAIGLLGNNGIGYWISNILKHHQERGVHSPLVKCVLWLLLSEYSTVLANCNVTYRYSPNRNASEERRHQLEVVVSRTIWSSSTHAIELLGNYGIGYWIPYILKHYEEWGLDNPLVKCVLWLLLSDNSTVLANCNVTYRYSLNRNASEERRHQLEVVALRTIRSSGTGY